MLAYTIKRQSACLRKNLSLVENLKIPFAVSTKFYNIHPWVVKITNEHNVYYIVSYFPTEEFEVRILWRIWILFVLSTADNIFGTQYAFKL